MPFVHVGKLSGLPPESVMEVLVDGQPYAICRVGASVHALNGICLHRGGPLGQGQIHDGRVVCPFHLWEFDCRTGEYEYDQTKCVATYEVKLEGDEILLQVSESA
jgi:nitrite reductase/ring-hydroxylating ferredoxin subunit